MLLILQFLLKKLPEIKPRSSLELKSSKDLVQTLSSEKTTNKMKLKKMVVIMEMSLIMVNKTNQRMMMNVKVKLIIHINNRDHPKSMENKGNLNKLTKKLKIALLKTNRQVNIIIHSNHVNLINLFQPTKAIIHKMIVLLKEIIANNDLQQDDNLRLVMVRNNLNSMNLLLSTKVSRHKIILQGHAKEGNLNRALKTTMDNSQVNLTSQLLLTRVLLITYLIPHLRFKNVDLSSSKFKRTIRNDQVNRMHLLQRIRVLLMKLMR